MKSNTAISITIITNRNDEVFQRTVQSYVNSVDEIFIAVNGQNINVEKLREQWQTYPQVKVEYIAWQGYGETKNAAHQRCQNDWILSVDSDEMATPELLEYVTSFKPSHQHQVFQFKRKNYIGETYLKYGSWGRGKKYFPRLYNKTCTRWNDSKVHEELIITPQHELVTTEATLLHFTAKDITEVREKNTLYARLSAEQRYQQGKRVGVFKKYVSYIYTFIKEYIFLRGFLDGVMGFKIALENAMYSYKKYHYLFMLHQKNN